MSEHVYVYLTRTLVNYFSDATIRKESNTYRSPQITRINGAFARFASKFSYDLFGNYAFFKLWLFYYHQLWHYDVLKNVYHY